METLALGIGGMHCGACAANIEKRLYGVDGVQSAAVSFLQESADIVYDPARISAANIVNAVAETGYSAHLPGATLAAEYTPPLSRASTNSGCG